MSRQRNPFTWNVRLGPVRFNSPVSPVLINLLFWIVVAFCCCAPCVMALFTA